MDKPNTFESVDPCSGAYSFKRDLRLNAWLFFAMVAHLAGLFLAKRHPEWTPLTRGLVALSPLLPGLLYVWDCMRFIRGMDELQRGIQMGAWLFAVLGTVIIGAVINTMNACGVDLGPLRHGLGLGGNFTSVFVLWAVAIGFGNRRYK
jgi:hypothetical protein